MGYSIMPYIFGTAFFLLGIYMAALPLKCTKEEKRSEVKEIKKTRRNGIVLATVAVIMIVANMFFSQI